MTPTLSRYVVREILLHLLGVLVIVMSVFLVQRLSGYLGDAAAGQLPANVVFNLLGIRTLMALPSLLPVALYLGIVLGLGRLYADNEMTALAACGVGPLRVPQTVLVLALAFAALTAGVSIWVRPWAAGKFDEVKRSAVAQFNVGGLEAGRFYEVGNKGKRVIFADRHSRETGAMEHVFVQDLDDGRLSIFVSDRALEYIDEGSGYRFLTLLDGERYDLRVQEEKFEITEYSKLVIRTDLSEILTDEEPARKGQRTGALLGSTHLEDIAELQWRVAMPMHALLLALLGIPLSRVDPRQGKFAKLLIAILLYVVYRQALGTAKTWVEDGTLPPFPGLWLVHGLWLLGTLAYTLRRPLLQRGLGGWSVLKRAEARSV